MSYTYFLSHLTTGVALFRYRKVTNPVYIFKTAQHVWRSGQNCFLSRASVTHIHLSPGEYMFSQIHHCICAFWLSILLVSFFAGPRNKVFLLLRLLLSPGSLMHGEYIPVVCVPRLLGHDPGSFYVLLSREMCHCCLFFLT